MMNRLFGAVTLLCLLLIGCGTDTGDDADSGRLSTSDPAREEAIGPDRASDVCADPDTAFNVETFDPLSGSKDIAFDREVFSISFNANVDPTSVMDIALKERGSDGEPVLIEAVVDQPSSVVMLAAKTELKFDTIYDIVVPTSVKADCETAQDKPLTADKTSDFRTAADDAPRVASTTPVNGEQNIQTDTDPVITFNQNVDAQSDAVVIFVTDSNDSDFSNAAELSTAAYRVEGDNGSALNNTQSIVINFVDDLEAGRQYKVELDGQKVTNENGTPLVNSSDGRNLYSFIFRTEADFLPVITRVTPADNDLGVSRDSKIIIDFSEAIEIDDNSTAFQLAGTPDINLDVLLLNADTQVVITPNNADSSSPVLNADTLHTLTISKSAIKDKQGNLLESDDSTSAVIQFRFTTVAQGLEPNAPNTLSVSPMGTVTGASPTTDIVIEVEGQVTFNGDEMSMEDCPTVNSQAIVLRRTNSDGTHLDGDSVVDPANYTVKSSYNEVNDRSTIRLSFKKEAKCPSADPTPASDEAPFRLENSAFYTYDFNPNIVNVNGISFNDPVKQVDSGTASPKTSNDRDDLLEQTFRVRSTLVVLDTDVLRLLGDNGLSPLESEVNGLFNRLYRNPELTGDLVGDTVDGGGVLEAVVLEIPLTTPLTTEAADPLNDEDTDLLDRDSVVAVCNPYVETNPCVLKLNLNLDSSGLLAGSDGGLVADLVEGNEDACGEQDTGRDDLCIGLVVAEDGSLTNLLSTPLGNSAIGQVIEALMLQSIINTVDGALSQTSLENSSLLDVSLLEGTAIRVDLFGRETATLLRLNDDGGVSLIELMGVSSENFAEMLGDSASPMQ